MYTTTNEKANSNFTIDITRGVFKIHKKWPNGDELVEFNVPLDT